MSHLINHIYYLDDDSDDHHFFSLAISEVHPVAAIYPFYQCQVMLDHLSNLDNILPDIIFIDQNIEGNRDNECLKEIKRISRINHIPVIIYTTGANPRLMASAIEIGAYKYVIKPTYHCEIKTNLSALFSEYEGLPS